MRAQVVIVIAVANFSAAAALGLPLGPDWVANPLRVDEPAPRSGNGRQRLRAAEHATESLALTATSPISAWWAGRVKMWFMVSPVEKEKPLLHSRPVSVALYCAIALAVVTMLLMLLLLSLFATRVTATETAHVGDPGDNGLRSYFTSMRSWFAFVINVSSVFSGIPLDLIYAFLNICMLPSTVKEISEIMPWALQSGQLMVVFYTVALAPVYRLLVSIPIAWDMFLVSRSVLVAMAMAASSEVLLAKSIAERTEQMAKYSKSDSGDARQGCCQCSGLEPAEVEAVRYLLSEEERCQLVDVGGLDETSKAILDVPLTAEEEGQLEEWDSELLAEDDTPLKCQYGDNHKWFASCRGKTPKYIVQRCKGLVQFPRRFWCEVCMNLLSPSSFMFESPLPSRFLLVFKCQLYGAITNGLLYAFRIASLKFQWWEPARLFSIAMALYYIFNLRHLRVLRSKYPLSHGGMMLTSKFKASSMWSSWCEALVSGFMWCKYPDVWEAVGLDARESEDGRA